MSDPSSIATKDVEIDAEPEVSYENGNTIESIEHKIQKASSSDEFPPRTLIIKRKAKRKEDGPLEIVCGFIVEHQIGMMETLAHFPEFWLTRYPGLAINLLMLLGLTHMTFPRARRHTRKFFELSYYDPKSGEYRAGWNDAWMVSFYIVVFTGLRASVMDYILAPLATYGGVKSKRDLTRFAEQAWLLIYYSVFWTLGMVKQSLYLIPFRY